MYGYGNSMFLATHGILARSASGGGVDPDAQAFITAASITDPTQQSAINQLVVDLKGYNIWTKFSALYPFCGSTASQHKWNLKDPRDLDVAFRLVFSGGWTHSVNGATPNGTNGFANTFFIPSTNLSLNSTHISGYLRTSLNSDAPILSAENASTYNNGLYIWPKQVSFGYSVRINDNTSQPGGTNTDDIRGFHVALRTASNVKKYRLNNTEKFNVTTASTALNTSSIYLAASRNNANYFNNQIAFASIGDGLTDTEAANFYTAVQTFQTTLGRSIGTQTVSDADAQAFVTNAGIVDQVEANAINNLVIGLKADGLWTKMKACYPMVGGSSSTMKFNLKNPLDTDAAFRLVFNGGWTFSSNGALPNGTNAYANTYLNALSTLSSTSYHLSYYSRTQDTSKNAHDMGAEGSSDTNLDLYLYYNSVSAKGFLDGTYPTLAVQINNTDTTGFQIGNRTSIDLMNLWWDGSKLATNTATDNRALPSLNIFIGATNTSGSGTAFSNKQCAFASIGDGLTDTDSTNLNTRVTTFQTALNRNV